VESGRATRFDHDEHGAVSAIARIVQLQRYGRRPDTRAPTLGEHTREIAASARIDEDRVNELVAAGVLRTAD
jgi:crotonobetainyl-CoA:carnitine CoA-transferase CaiB-like acyl-CoA transferase